MSGQGQQSGSSQTTFSNGLQKLLQGSTGDWSRKPAEAWNRLVPEIKQQKVYYVIRIPV